MLHRTVVIPVVSMSYMILMLLICRIWLPCTYLIRCLLCVPADFMMNLMSDVLGTHGHA
jgi:hypothetical protein